MYSKFSTYCELLVLLIFYGVVSATQRVTHIFRNFLSLKFLSTANIPTLKRRKGIYSPIILRKGHYGDSNQVLEERKYKYALIIASNDDSMKFFENFFRGDLSIHIQHEVSVCY